MTRRLWRGLAVFVLLLAAAGLLIFSGVRHQDATIDNVVQPLQPLQITNLQIRSDFANSQAVLRGYLITRQPRFLVLYRASRNDLQAALARADRLARGGWRRDIAAQRRESAIWFGYAGRMQGLAAGAAALSRLTDQGFPSAGAFYQVNDRLRVQLAARTRRAISESERALDAAVAWSGVLAFAAVLLALAAGAGTIRGVTRPLAGLTATLRLLRSGDHGARADLTGAAETDEVARSLNALADEGDRLRAQEAQASRLRATAREGGIRIREHLRAQDVISEARRVLEDSVDAEAVYLHLLEEGAVTPPVGHERDWMFPDGFAGDFPASSLERFRQVFRTHASLLIQDVQGGEGDRIQPTLRGALRRAGVVSVLITPFGVGADMLGFIVAARLRTGRRWTRDEADAVESIATDLGRGLHHARLYEAENHLVKELQTVDQAKSDFLATVSHELRTPLTSIAGYLEILRGKDAGPLSPVQARMLETVDRNTSRLRHLIEDVLTLSRIESGVFRTVMMPVNLADVVDAAVTALRPAAAAKDVALSLSYTGAGTGLVVAGDPGQLDRVLMNLLSNAVKFTSGGGEVRVAAAAVGGMAAVEVGDTGLGIPDADQKELFTRFFRASNAVRLSIPGTGLGLAIVRTIIDNHRGTITVESREGQGTTVRVEIPLLASGGGPGDLLASGDASGPGDRGDLRPGWRHREAGAPAHGRAGRGGGGPV